MASDISNPANAAIALALVGSQCVVFRGAGIQGRAANSTLSSIPEVRLTDTGLGPANLRTAATVVRIAGSTDEPLHYHVSAIVGLILKGEALLRTADGPASSERVLRVDEGDIVVIPKGCWHLFECPSGRSMEYLALELSETTIDYQKHWK